MAGKLTARGVESLSRRKGRFSDGDGLFLRTLEPGRRVYWVYRFLFGGKEREMSLGSYPTVSLAEARAKHRDFWMKVKKDNVDPIIERHSWRASTIEKRINPPRLRLTRAEAPDLTHLYRHYDFDGQLLYVGVSNNVVARLTRHKRQAPWADHIATIRVDHYPTRAAAEEAEAEAIITEKPRFNDNVRLSRRKGWGHPKPEVPQQTEAAE
jgi:hypothetical protein